MRRGFTLIELIFVIVIIGILAAVALPRFQNLKQNAEITNVVQAINELNSSGGHSAYLNATELNDINSSALNLTDIYKFQGRWTIGDNNDSATYTSKDGKFQAKILYNNDGTVTITFPTCDAPYDTLMAKRGFACPDTAGITLDLSNE